MQQRNSRPVSGRNRFPRCFLLSLLLAVPFGRAGYADQVKLKIIAINETLVCEGDKTVFTVDDDGALNGPQGGFLGRLTKKK